MTSITSDMENAFVWSNFVREDNTWLGGTDVTGDTARNWSWADSSTWSFTKWRSGQDGTAGIDNSHDCIHMRKADQTWDDISCGSSSSTSTRPYVCKK